MSESSSPENQGNRNHRSNSRGGGGQRGGNRNNRNRSKGGNRGRTRRPEPKPTGFQKFVKAITFGLIDLTPKRGKGKKGGNSGEKRKPRLVEPTTPRLYVGNLDYGATDEDLVAYFSTIGEVKSASVIKQGERSKGFAFVEMGSLEEAKNAAFNLNDKEFQGRNLLVTGAKGEKKKSDGPRGDRPPRDGRREGGRDGRSGGRDGNRGGRDGRRGGNDRRGNKPDRVEKPTRTVKPLEIEQVSSPKLFLASVNAKASDEDLTDLFSGIGTLQSHVVAGESDESAVTKDFNIEMASTEDAQKAVEFLHDKSFMGHRISVTGAKE